MHFGSTTGEGLYIRAARGKKTQPQHQRNHCFVCLVGRNKDLHLQAFSTLRASVMTRFRLVKRCRPRHMLPCREAQQQHEEAMQEQAAVMGLSSLVLIGPQRCRAILQALAEAARVERPRVLTEAFMLGAVRDAISREVRRLVVVGEADRGRIIGTLEIFELYLQKLGTGGEQLDTTNGLIEVLQSVRDSGRLQGSETEDRESRSIAWPDFIHDDTNAERQCCSFGFIVDRGQIYAHGSGAFEAVFGPTHVISERILAWRLTSFYAWMPMIAKKDLSTFYEVLTQAMLAIGRREKFVVSKCITHRGETIPFLIGIQRFCGSLADGNPVRGYRIRFWPVNHGSIDSYLEAAEGLIPAAPPMPEPTSVSASGHGATCGAAAGSMGQGGRDMAIG